MRKAAKMLQGMERRKKLSDVLTVGNCAFLCIMRKIIFFNDKAISMAVDRFIKLIN